MNNLEKLAYLALHAPREMPARTVVKEQNCCHCRERTISLKTQRSYHDRLRLIIMILWHFTRCGEFSKGLTCLNIERKLYTYRNSNREQLRKIHQL